MAETSKARPYSAAELRHLADQVGEDEPEGVAPAIRATADEIGRLTRERDEFKTWWVRDSTGLGKALGELAMLRAVKEDQRAEIERLTRERDEAMADRDHSDALLSSFITERDRLRALLADSQARIDALMLEYCPDRMTPEQLDEWAAHQVPASEPEKEHG